LIPFKDVLPINNLQNQTVETILAENETMDFSDLVLERVSEEENVRNKPKIIELYRFTS
jgi:hypothetical protein